MAVALPRARANASIAATTTIAAYPFVTATCFCGTLIAWLNLRERKKLFDVATDRARQTVEDRQDAEGFLVW